MFDQQLLGSERLIAVGVDGGNIAGPGGQVVLQGGEFDFQAGQFDSPLIQGPGQFVDEFAGVFLVHPGVQCLRAVDICFFGKDTEVLTGLLEVLFEAFAGCV
ncbi:hypothetical protein D3C87_1862550 [compost metagenome]